MHNQSYILLSQKAPNIWASTICDALGGISDANYCSDCRITVCWLCWLDPVHTPCRGRLAHYACWECWETSFETLRQRRPNRFSSTKFNNTSWKTAQKEGAFCQCIASILCSACPDRRRLCPAQTPAKGLVDVRCVLDSRTYTYLAVSAEGIGFPQYECAGCVTHISDNDRSPPHQFCPNCNLPMQMRNHDHPANRQSQGNGIYCDDVNYDTGRVGPDYESVKEFWARECTRAQEGDWETFPPEDWESVEFSWELFNKASLFPAGKKSNIARSSYFQPIRAPVWDFEEILFTPPPFVTTFNRWQDIKRGGGLLLYCEKMMTFEEYMKWYGYTDETLEERRKALAALLPSHYPTVRNFLVRAEYFNPIQRPVWDFEHAIFEMTDRN